MNKISFPYDSFLQRAIDRSEKASKDPSVPRVFSNIVIEAVRSFVFLLSKGKVDLIDE